MTVLVAGTDTDEGRAAHRFALQEAARRQEDLLYFVLSGGRPDCSIADGAGVEESYAEREALGRDAIGDLLDTAERVGVSTIVVGVRRRTPVGKLFLGSAAQQIILEANAPVICIKP